MKIKKLTKSWWGAPRQFTTDLEERKVSWLELFYDLVYVIAISTITHHLAAHFSISGLLDYFYLFIIIYWGWLNGSLYHDLHGTSGLRTKLMTLWQMVIIAALVITINGSSANLLFNATIVILIMQLYITYLWWSVGLYDKNHRRLNKRYTTLYLASFVLMLAALFLEPPYLRPLFYLTLILNYLPSYVTEPLLKKEDLQLNLSASMSERLGLFTIIIFGELVLGVINGISSLHQLNLDIWILFVLSICIVFALWWIFFTLVSDRPCKDGFTTGTTLEILYIPTLMSLGLLSVSFTAVFEDYTHTDMHSYWIKNTFGYSPAIFLAGICCMISFLKYPEELTNFRRKVQRALLLTALLFGILTFTELPMELLPYLITILVILLLLIFYINRSWYILKATRPETSGEGGQN